MNIKFHHICIETNCYKESITFYESILGFNKIDESINFHGRKFNTWLKNHDIIIELQTPKNEMENKVIGNLGLMHICFSIDNLDIFINEIKRKGTIHFKDNIEKYEVNGKFISKIISPEGTIIEFREEEKMHLTTAST